MNTAELRTFVGMFGMIRAEAKGYFKTMPGHIKEMDKRGNIYFVCNDGYSFIFTPEQVDTFKPEEFLPAKEKPVFVSEPVKQPKVKKYTTCLFKVFFTIDGKEDYFFVEGDNLERARNTAIDLVKSQKLDYVANNVYSIRMNA
jgi:hypothetical protein